MAKYDDRTVIIGITNPIKKTVSHFLCENEIDIGENRRVTILPGIVLTVTSIQGHDAPPPQALQPPMTLYRSHSGSDSLCFYFLPFLDCGLLAGRTTRKGTTKVGGFISFPYCSLHCSGKSSKIRS